MKMKKQKIEKQQLIEMLSQMDDEQFKEFSKNHNREMHALWNWQFGVEIEAKYSFKLAHEIMNQSVVCDELAAFANDNPDNQEVAEQLALEQFKLTQLFNDIENKVDSFGAVVRLMERDVDKYKALADVVTKKARQSQKQVENFKQRIAVLLKSIDMTKVEGTFFSISLGKPSYELTVDEFTDEQFETLPEQFIKVKKDLDKTAVKNAILDGEKIPWASLTQKVGIVIR
jgi:hypothetical protein